MDMFGDYDQFTVNEEQYYFVRLIKNRFLLAWKEDKTGEAVCLGVRVENVGKEELERLGVWKDLPKKTQTAVEKAVEEEKVAAAERMAHARRGRRKKYNFSGLPENLTCRCGNTVKANYYVLQKKAEEKVIPLADLIKAYECRACKKQAKQKKKEQNKEKELDTVS